MSLKALELVIDNSSGGTEASRYMMKKKLRKAHRQGRFGLPDDPEWLFRICCASLMLEDFNWNGWEHRDPWAQMLWYNQDALGKPKWNGEEGKVLVLGEQGLGDEIMFASCLPIKNEIGITCNPRLRTIFERNFNCPVFDRNVGKELSLAKEVLKDYDYYIGFGDLPRLLRHKSSDFPGKPYLKPDPERVKEVEKYRGMTGISWRGRNGFYPLKDFPEGLSLQYDLNWDEEPLETDIDVRDDMEGLFALISVLDRVVCVSTTVAHFAGALGTKTDVILAPPETARSGNQINWRWGQRKKSVWYDCVTVYRNLKQWRRENGIR